MQSWGWHNRLLAGAGGAGSPTLGLEREMGFWKRVEKTRELGFTLVESCVQDCRSQEGWGLRKCP